TIMKPTISISEILNIVRSGHIVNTIKLLDASRYAGNSNGEMSFNSTLWYKKYVAMRDQNDEVLTMAGKEINVSEIGRILSQLIGKGDVYVWISGEECARVGEVVE
ncbi:hypothetical protein, partial [Alistipes shahii]